MEPEPREREPEFLVREDLYGWPVLDRSGQRTGRVYQLYEDATGRPRYLGVRRRLIGRATLLPVDLLELDSEAEEVRTPWNKEALEAAPRYEGDEPITPELQRSIYAHFGRGAGEGTESGEMVRSEEELRITTREVPYGVAHLRKRVEVVPVEERVPLFAEYAEVEEVVVSDPSADPGTVLTTPEGDLSVPVVAERLVVRKERVVVKRVILRRRRRQVREEIVSDVLRRERVEVEIDRPEAGERALQRASGGEDLSRGPTPETRHAEGGLDDVRDTTEGPTPEIRRAERLAKGGQAQAAGEPRLDPRTRADVGGEQDRLDLERQPERIDIPDDTPRVLREE
jgi:stress response protein YsnF